MWTILAQSILGIRNSIYKGPQAEDGKSLFPGELDVEYDCSSAGVGKTLVRGPFPQGSKEPWKAWKWGGR